MRALLILGLLAPVVLSATEVAALFTNGAVLQHGRPVPVWGSGRPGEAVTVAFAGATVETRADASGHWRAQLPAMKPGVSGALVVKGQDTVRVDDVVTGDVWLCAGQSNMQMTLAGAAGGEEAIKAVALPQIRQFKVAIQVSTSPMADVRGRWVSCRPSTAADFSAVGFYFAREIHAAQGIPVGIINVTRGGSPIEAWVRPEALPAGSLGEAVSARWRAQSVRVSTAKRADVRVGPFDEAELGTSPTGAGGYGELGSLDGGMIAPLTAFPLRGVLWYQGEANTAKQFAPPAEYAELFRAMIEDWRKQWGQSDLPFYFVQLPANNLPERDWNGQMWAGIREGQRQALQLPHTGMAVTIDLGQPEIIHPTNKEPIGHRLALLARALTYGETLPSSGPVFASLERKSDALRLHFQPSKDVLRARDSRPISGLEVCGRDGVYFSAIGEIDGDTLVVRSERVIEPVGVRYAWKQNPADANLTNSTELPAAPFVAALGNDAR